MYTYGQNNAIHVYEEDERGQAIQKVAEGYPLELVRIIRPCIVCGIELEAMLYSTSPCHSDAFHNTLDNEAID